MTRSRFPRRLLALASLAAVALAIAAEATARWGFGLGDPPLNVADPEIEYLLKPGSYQRFGNRMLVNAWHMRSQEFPARKEDPAEFRVMVFGDSVLNGGALTDQADLATEILQRDLATKLSRPVIVGNISAGSWGPSNMLAYARKFGFFDADVVVVLLNSMDIGDNPSGKPIVGVDPAFPARRPLMAVEELVRRYLWPRVQKIAGRGLGAGAAEAESRIDGQAEAVKTVTDLKALCSLAAGSGAVVLIAHFPTRNEVTGGLFGGHAVIKQTADETAMPIVEMHEALARSLEAGEEPYRPNDSIHPNVVGQQIIAEALCSAIVNRMRAL